MYQVESLTTFIWRIFWYNASFWQHWALKGIYFSIFVHFGILKMVILGAPWLLSMRPLIFLYQFESLTTFIWNIFCIMRIFGSVESWSESTLPFSYILLFRKWQSDPNMVYVFTRVVLVLCLTWSGPVRRLVCKQHRLRMCLFAMRIHFRSFWPGSARLAVCKAPKDCMPQVLSQ